MNSNLYDINIDGIDIKDYTKIQNGQQEIMNELAILDSNINKIDLSGSPNYSGSFSNVYSYTSKINGKNYVLRDEKINQFYFLEAKAEVQTEFKIQQNLAKDDIAPKIYYAALYRKEQEPHFYFITIMDEYDNLYDYLQLVRLDKSIDESKKFNIFIEIFQQCFNLVYKMIFEHEFYCADQKIQNFVYKEDESTNTYDIKMIDFDNKFCNDYKIINNVIFKKGLSPEEIEKNKYYYMKSLWLQIILFFDIYNKNYLINNKLIEKIITKALKSNNNITGKYNEKTYDEFMCNNDFINWLIDKNDNNQMWIYNYYTLKTKDEINHKKILNCPPTPSPVLPTPPPVSPTPPLSPTSSTSTMPSLTFSSQSQLSQKSSPSPLSSYGGKNLNRKSNKKLNKKSNKKQNRKSNKKLNRKSNKNQNRK